MPYKRPELVELRDDSYGDIQRLTGADARLAMSNLSVLAHVVAGGMDGLHGHLEWLSKQILPDTAEEEMLIRHASVRKIFRRDAVPSEGLLRATGIADSTVEVGEQWVRSDGTRYVVTAETKFIGTTAVIPVKALDTGKVGNTLPGTSLTLVSPVLGVSSSAVVDENGLTGGTDKESIESLRQRLLRKIAKPISGGTTDDYEDWAMEVAGVTRAWCSPLELGPGTVTLRFMRDDDDDPIPNALAVEKVDAYINSECPVTAELFVVAPIAKPVNFEIELVPDSSAVRLAVAAELRALIRRDAAPAKTLLISRIREAISISAGEDDHVLISPSSNVLHGIGEIATMGTITWL